MCSAISRVGICYEHTDLSCLLYTLIADVIVPDIEVFSLLSMVLFLLILAIRLSRMALYFVCLPLSSGVVPQRHCTELLVEQM